VDEAAGGEQIMTAMPPGSAVPWAPEDLPVSRDELQSWRYVVLEEIVDDVAVLRMWPWPVVDPLGRLQWPDGAEHQTGEGAIDVALLQAQLYEPSKISRQPRCGDTFATSGAIDVNWNGEHVGDLRELLGDAQVYDVSADAREAAKIALQSSLGAIEPEHVTERSMLREVGDALSERAGHPLRPLRMVPPMRAGGGVLAQ
jgi:hypothetical protein